MDDRIVYGAPAWEVSLPGGRAASSFDAPQTGVLIIHDGSGEERISLPKQVAKLLSSKEKSGEISPASRKELLYIVWELLRTCARTRIERLIDRREYSSKEVEGKLVADGYPQGVIEECLERACEIGLVSDSRYADSFIRSKVYAGWGMGRISRELSQRGIEVSSVRGWPYDYLDPEDEVTRAVKLARTKHVSTARPYEKLVRYLCTKGYTTGVATRAARRVLAEREEGSVVDF